MTRTVRPSQERGTQVCLQSLGKKDLKKSTENMGMSSWSENLKDRDEQEMVAKKKLFMKKYAVHDTLPQKGLERRENRADLRKPSRLHRGLS